MSGGGTQVEQRTESRHKLPRTAEHRIKVRPLDWKAALYLLVPGGGFEPPRLAAAVFETATSTDSVTPARDAARLHSSQREARIITETAFANNRF